MAIEIATLRSCEWCGHRPAYRHDETGADACKRCVSERAAESARGERRAKQLHSFVIGEFRSFGAIV